MALKQWRFHMDFQFSPWGFYLISGIWLWWLYVPLIIVAIWFAIRRRTRHVASRLALTLLVVICLIPTVFSGSALVSNAMEGWRDSRQRADTWQRLQANEPATVATCVIGCDLPVDLDATTRDAALERSVKQVITWWGRAPQPSQMPSVMKAYLSSGEAMMQSDPAGAEAALHQAAALAADPRIVPALDSAEFGASQYNESYYDDVAERIQANLIVLHYRGLPGRQPDPSVLKDRCQAITAWPAAWMQGPEFAREDLKRACSMAYMRQFNNAMPPTDVPTVIDGVADPSVGGPEFR
jgi:nucleotide-binding universal stress UspA family protein